MHARYEAVTKRFGPQAAVRGARAVFFDADSGRRLG
jgi:hypothetical protein